MKTKKLLPLLLVFLFSGCFDLDLDFSDMAFELYFLPGVSLHPLYTEENIIFEEKLLGTWADDESKFKFEKAQDKDSYNLTFNTDNEMSEFTALLVKIDRMLFLDLFPQKPDSETIRVQDLLSVPTHMFIKIEQIEPTLKMRLMDPDKITEMLQNDPNSLKHEIVKEYYLLLTASTEHLQEFMREHANDDGLFGEPMDLERIQSEDPNKPLSIDPNQTDSNSIDSNDR